VFLKWTICTTQYIPTIVYEPFNVATSACTTIDLKQVLPIIVSRSITIQVHIIQENYVFSFSNIQVIRLTIKRATKSATHYLGGINTCERINNPIFATSILDLKIIYNLYFRLDNHVFITTKGESDLNFMHRKGRWSNTTQGMILTRLESTLNLNKKRKSIVTCATL